MLKVYAESGSGGSAKSGSRQGQSLIKQNMKKAGAPSRTIQNALSNARKLNAQITRT